jgi:hypothetical protein
VDGKVKNFMVCEYVSIHVKTCLAVFVNGQFSNADDGFGVR